MLTLPLTNARVEEMNRTYPWTTYGVARPAHVCMIVSEHEDLWIFKIHLRSGPIELHTCATTPQSAFCQAVAGWLITNGCERTRAENAGDQLRRALIN